ncbi:Uncharacterised protein [Mycobacteroides abscessus subsp. abscessus]|uniref:hypothetical protein n=1 Tax=Mycobacteroides abscessus TaxID=36809 RepID=UPI00092862BB|nr:hypothetical protein [Mycobacteroides abscessus]SII19082.1 Uncharacterised protein [Mycobacteroides abscessus subsp. abscessus]SII32354.1 Uncharacterised protein [Mycobacteroides abscessus subsp. abscessus]SII64265.1 Uncharacterised protein [Mycobacteroides abscessus subsp. abscessus]
MSNATQLPPARANTPPFLIEHIANGDNTDTLVNDEVVVSSWSGFDPAYGDQVFIAPLADGESSPGFQVGDEDAARQARTAIARTYIAGLRDGAR